MPKILIDILVGKNLLSLEEASKIRKEAKEKNLSPEDILYSHGISENDVAEAKGELAGLPTQYLKGLDINADALHDIPEESARHYKMIPLGRHDGYLDIGMLNPEDVASQEAIKFITTRLGLPARIFIITPSDLEATLSQYRSFSGEVTKALGEFEKEYETFGEEIKILKEEPTKIVEDAPVTKMMGVILRHAVEGKASDIHVEPGRNQLRVRFRVDGELHTSLLLPRDIHPALVTRIKVMTNLKIDENRIPQDGRFHAQISGKEIDFRVSTLPTSFGEKVAIRVLDPELGTITLESLGMEGRNLTELEEKIKKPYGMVLITGPTGSGKSTTLYAILKILNDEKTNIISLEDPIEYYIQGINQSNIRPEIGYDFATGLRHILRQDPDIIMVGEIRDKETAGLAIHAALTGHLVLSTLHTNNAIGVIPRLIDMGVDPFLISPTLICAIGQRLVKTLCDDSRKEIPIRGKIKEVVTKEIDTFPEPKKSDLRKKLTGNIYQSESSSTCPKGTRGRIGLFEVLSMTPQLEQIILSGPSEAKIQEEAQRQGMLTMKQDGIQKVLRGIIGMEELFEVV